MHRIAIAALISLAVAACGGSKATNSVPASNTPSPSATTASESAGDALMRQYAYMAKGQWGRWWDELHPGQQALVSRQAFVDCAQPTTVSGGQVVVVETYADAIDLRGVPERTSTAVTSRSTSGKQVDTRTAHEVLVDGKWRWVLSNSAIEAFTAGHCPS